MTWLLSNQAQVLFAVLALGWLLLDLLSKGRWFTPRAIFLFALTAFSFGSWFNYFHFADTNFIHETDGFHYYIGSKYFRELQYNELYNCALLADLESSPEPPLSERSLRDLRDDKIVTASEIEQEIHSCKDLFSALRWREFVKDVAWFKNQMPAERWQKIFFDHGFNASPVWLLVGNPLTNASPLDSNLWAVPFAADFILVAVLWFSIFFTFGAVPGCLALIFWSLFPLSEYGWVGGSILRHDWLLFTALGLCFLKRERYVLSGLAFSYGGLLRLFPLVIPCLILLHWGVRGILAKGLSSSERKGTLELLIAFLLGCSALFLYSGASYGGITVWENFSKNSVKHLATRTGNRVGLDTITSNLWYCDRENQPERCDLSNRESGSAPSKALIEGSLALAFVALSLFLQFRHSLVSVGLFSVGVIPLLTSLSCYYYSFFLFILCSMPTRRVSLWCFSCCFLFFRHFRFSPFQVT